MFEVRWRLLQESEMGLCGPLNVTGKSVSFEIIFMTCSIGEIAHVANQVSVQVFRVLMLFGAVFSIF